HDLVFFVGERQSRRNGDAIAGVHSHRIDVLDRADDDAVVRLVANDFHLELFPAEQTFIDEDLTDRRRIYPGTGNLLVFFAVVSDAAARAAEGEGRPDDCREADRVERTHSFRQTSGSIIVDVAVRIDEFG